MKKYTHSEFLQTVKIFSSWVDDLLEEYSSKKEKILVKCKNGHSILCDCKSLCRYDKLKDCPECKREKKENRFCKHCNKKLKPTQNIFCSSSCAATYNNLHREPKIQKFCFNCGKLLNCTQHKFCSLKCSTEFREKEAIARWKNGERLSDSDSISSYIRHYLFKKYDNKCSRCGWSEVNPFSNKIPLEVHHKDGDSKNDKEENLELLCPCCHSLTETFKGLNYGKGTRQKYEKRNS